VVLRELTMKIQLNEFVKNKAGIISSKVTSSSHDIAEMF
jgi:hypothetical protein